ncbi:MAG: hypothetical protein ACOCZ8_04270 [Bacteroidota bacterium]
MRKELEAIEREVRQKLQAIQGLESLKFELSVRNDDEHQPEFIVKFYVRTGSNEEQVLYNKRETIKDIFWRAAQRYYSVLGLGFIYIEAQPSTGTT